MFEKNLVLELWSKILKANQNAGFFKLKYLANKLKFNFSMWLEVHENKKCYLAASSGCGQACLDMPKVMTISDSVLS